MIATVETLLLFIVSLIGVLLYRSLVRSRWFNQLVGEVIEPPPEGDEVVDRIQADLDHAAQVLRDVQAQAEKATETAKSIKAELPPPKPWSPAEATPEATPEAAPAAKKPRKSRKKKLPETSEEIPPDSANG